MIKRLAGEHGDGSLWNREGLSPRVFLILCLLFVVVSRLALIAATPSSTRFNDIQIDHGAGAMLVRGLDLYDPNDQPKVRQEIREKIARVNSIAATQKDWEFVITTNLPMNNFLYGAFEKISGGSLFVWRLLFATGDVLILVAAYAFFAAFRGPPTRLFDQAAIFCLCCVYPSLLIDGTIIPEEKQFQTAMLLGFVAVAYREWRNKPLADVLAGAILSLSILYKLFGIFLIPLYVVKYIRARLPRMALSAISGLVPLALLVAGFGPGFIAAMAERGRDNSVSMPMHASPWSLLSGLGSDTLMNLRIGSVVLIVGVVSYLLHRKRIDLLNFCAALLVTFACVWLTKSSINRMNIAMIFAMMSLASLSIPAFRILIAGNAIFQAVAYPAIYLMLDRNLSLGYKDEFIESIVTTAFLFSYAAVLFSLPSPEKGEASSARLVESRAADGASPAEAVASA
jgi:hypothetical protein